MNALEERAYRCTVQALERVSPAKAADVYVVSFFVYDEEDDPRLSTLAVGTNTNAQVDASTPGSWDADEARWNYACWLQERRFVLCGSHEDPEGADLRRRWIESMSLWYSDDDEEPVVDARAGRIANEFVELAVRLAQRLHSTGVIERAFGRPIPIVIHEYEYYPEIAERTERANPPGLTDEFSRWVLGR